MSETNVPGAGVNPQRVVKPSKRLKALHRAMETCQSFKSFVRQASEGDDEQLAEYAKVYTSNKSAVFTAEARKTRKAKVRAAQAATKRPKGEKGKSKDSSDKT